MWIATDRCQRLSAVANAWTCGALACGLLPIVSEGYTRAEEVFSMSYFATFYGPAIYDRYFQVGRQSAQLLVESIQRYLQPEMQILDVGTGTGFVAFALVPLLERGQIIGIDADENALVFAQYKAQKQGLANLTFQKGDALQLAFADNSFDLALANQIPLDQAKV